VHVSKLEADRNVVNFAEETINPQKSGGHGFNSPPKNLREQD